jgi:SAM-dependent methyltransferase
MLSIAQVEQNLRDLAPWHFNMEVMPGITTAAYNKQSYDDIDLDKVGVIDPDEMRDLLKIVLPDQGVKRRTFLDVGCNAGGYCFVAHELGAKLCYGFDVREHWIRQAEFIRSIKYPNSNSLHFRLADVKTFPHDQQYDVTLFKGVFYHLPDPIGMLVKLCELTGRAIIVDSASRSDIPGDCMVPWWESTTHVMSGVDGLAWFPGGPEVVGAILKYGGFPHMRVVKHIKGGKAERFRGRFRVIAARQVEDLAAFDAHSKRGEASAR